MSMSELVIFTLPLESCSASSEPATSGKTPSTRLPGPSTVTVTSSRPARSESLAVSRRTYVVGRSKVTLVDALVGSAKVGVPGPLTLPHSCETVAGGFGRPSSVTTQPRFAAAGVVTVWSVPAFTTGG
jgi:hypothetical protein